MFVEVLSLTYHSSITIEALTCGVQLSTPQYFQTCPGLTPEAGEIAAVGRTGNAGRRHAHVLLP